MAPHQLVEAVRAVELGPQVVELALLAALLGRLAHEALQLVHVEGLGQVVVGARLHGVDRHAQVRIGGDEDDRDRLVDGQDLGQHPRAGLAGHPYVQQRHVDPAGAEDRQRGGAVGRFQHLELALEDQPQRFADARLVVDREHHRSRRVHRRGVMAARRILTCTLLGRHWRCPHGSLE